MTTPARAKRLVHVVGARPNFPKMAPVRAALENYGLDQIVLHTGQHFDAAMSDDFFVDLGIPAADVNLEVRGGTHASQTARAMMGIDDYLERNAVDGVVVYGDVNSTLAATLVAVKRGIPLVHVEAGLRSGDRTMPEEINRVLVDSVADLLLTTSEDAGSNLVKEGRPRAAIRFVGNTMIDSLLRVRAQTESREATARRYAVATFHRPANVDSSVSARSVVRAIADVAEQIDVVIPLHPRSRTQLEAAGLGNISGVTVVPPVGYSAFVALLSKARLVVTDSGGIQEETTALGIPCLTLRTTTERPVTITHGSNQLVTAQSLRSATEAVLDDSWRPRGVPDLWDGHAGIRAAQAIVDFVQEA